MLPWTRTIKLLQTFYPRFFKSTSCVVLVPFDLIWTRDRIEMVPISPQSPQNYHIVTSSILYYAPPFRTRTYIRYFVWFHVESLSHARSHQERHSTKARPMDRAPCNDRVPRLGATSDCRPSQIRYATRKTRAG